jgi:hypothetical protein
MKKLEVLTNPQSLTSLLVQKIFTFNKFQHVEECL